MATLGGGLWEIVSYTPFYPEGTANHIVSQFEVRLAKTVESPTKTPTLSAIGGWNINGTDIGRSVDFDVGTTWLRNNEINGSAWDIYNPFDYQLPSDILPDVPQMFYPTPVMETSGIRYLPITSAELGLPTTLTLPAAVKNVGFAEEVSFNLSTVEKTLTFGGTYSQRRLTITDIRFIEQFELSLFEEEIGDGAALEGHYVTRPGTALQTSHTYWYWDLRYTAYYNTDLAYTYHSNPYWQGVTGVRANRNAPDGDYKVTVNESSTGGQPIVSTLQLNASLKYQIINEVPRSF